MLARAAARAATLARPCDPFKEDAQISPPDGLYLIEVEIKPDGYAASVQRRHADGTPLWRHGPPEGGEDAFVSVELHASEVAMTSWSGWRITVNADTGVETGRAFTK